MKTFALSALISFTATPAFAQTKVHHEEYYVIRDTATKRCTIVDKRPATGATPSTIVSLGVFKTRAEAEAGLKKMDVCDDEDKDEDEDRHGD
ncbi:hypothetical protein GGQ85_000402 [Nitrobacter vulgaris]|uniref:hypothetical protein n=1 Tax=Nitrobacter vulgaris TaxID=29421 RepID=UPI0028652EA9|nr:hypothetical protein [Nitrobacter vulgaris]MDR6302726.1 hypothetical protein [Nitrobacter vulgaris]